MNQLCICGHEQSEHFYNPFEYVKKPCHKFASHCSDFRPAAPKEHKERCGVVCNNPACTIGENVICFCPCHPSKLAAPKEKLQEAAKKVSERFGRAIERLDNSTIDDIVKEFREKFDYLYPTDSTQDTGFLNRGTEKDLESFLTSKLELIEKEAYERGAKDGVKDFIERLADAKDAEDALPEIKEYIARHQSLQ